MRCVRYLAAVLAAALLFAGCGTAAGASGTGAAQTVQQECNLPRDSRLRVFYGKSDDAVVFCGNKIVYESAVGESVSLLKDSCTDETDYFMVGTQAKGRYEYTVYTADGKPYYSCGENDYFGLQNGWLIMAESTGEYWYDDRVIEELRLLHLPSGKTKTLEVDSARVNAVGDYYAIQKWGYDDGSENSTHSYVNLYNHDWELVYPLEGYYSVEATGFGKDWLYFYGENSNALANLATGEWLFDVTLCGGEVYAQQQEDGRYAVYNINTRQLLGVYDGADQYLEDGMLYYNNYMDWQYPIQHYLLETVDETGGYLHSVDKNSTYLSDDRRMTVVRLVDEIRLYDTDGSLIFAQPFAALKQEQQQDDYYYEPLVTEKAILVRQYEESDDWNRAVIAYSLLDENGVRWSLSGKDAARYTSIYNWSDMDFLLGVRAGRGTQYEALYDIISVKDGSVLVSGVASVGYYGDGFFRCRRGFEEGWMNMEGEWLWHRSMWQSTSDNSGNSFYW